MSYLEIVNLIFSIVGGLISVLSLHYVIFLVIGIFARKKYPKTEVKHKYGLIIPARNEEKVVGNLIKSIYKQSYPQDKMQIFVIAHNCTDRTAEIARELGATVYEYNNPNECTMGYAFRYLFDQIIKDYGVENYDGFFLFNADNILSYNYIEKMNDAFEYFKCKNVVTSFRNSKNFGTNVISGLYGVHFMSGCRFESRGRTICGCSTRVQGTGYVIPSEIVKDGWKYVTLTEDWEFSADQILRGRKINYCDEAEFFDEQPTGVKVMLRQRLRWSRGHLLVFFTRAKALFKSIFTRKSKLPKDESGNPTEPTRFSKYDIFTNILPFYIIATFLFLLQFILCAIAPLIEPVDVGAYWIGWLKSTGISLATAYVTGVLSAIIIFIGERKRIQGVSFIKKVLVSLTWPIFIALCIPIDIVAMFARNLGWKTIPHNDTTNFEQLNQKQIAETSATQTETNEGGESEAVPEAQSSSDVPAEETQEEPPKANKKKKK